MQKQDIFIAAFNYKEQPLPMVKVRSKVQKRLAELDSKLLEIKDVLSDIDILEEAGLFSQAGKLASLINAERIKLKQCFEVRKQAVESVVPYTARKRH